MFSTTSQGVLTLMKETAENRRQWIRNERPTVKVILDEFPCLKEYAVVSHECKLMCLCIVCLNGLCHMCSVFIDVTCVVFIDVMCVVFIDVTYVACSLTSRV